MAELQSQDSLKLVQNFSHSRPRIALILSSALVLGLTLMFNGLSTGGDGTGLFLSNQANLSDQFYLSITPAGWTFSIWGIIYLFQVCWVIISIAAIFVRGSDGYLYVRPEVFPVTTFLFYIFGNLMNISWLFAFDREILILSLFFILFIAVSMWAVVTFSMTAFHRQNGQMQKQFHWLWTTGIRVCLHNGVAMYATWTSIATLLNLAHVFVYRGEILESSASTAILVILLVELIVFAIVDVAFVDRYFRYLVTPYITFIIALIGSATNGTSSRDTEPKTTVNENFTIALLVIACVLFAAKMLWWIRRPLGTNKM